MKIPETISENDDFIVLISHAEDCIPDREGKEISLKILLQHSYGTIYTVHRLDRDTSGLIVFAKNEVEHANIFPGNLKNHNQKIYNGFVLGKPDTAKRSY